MNITNNQKMLYTNTFDYDEDILVEKEIASDNGQHAELIVYNDDHNTFDWVIKCFTEILKHGFTQAEQLSLLIHFKGKATVKTGVKKVLKPLKDALVDRGLSAVIEDIED